MTNTDRIEKNVLLRAPKSRVWRALTNSEEFGTWFRVKLESDFAVGKDVTGNVTYPGYEHLRFTVTVERMDAEQLFSFRWHPNAVERDVDYSAEPTTVVQFSLKEVANGVMLTITESGFDQIPQARRANAFTANEKGWTIVVDLIEKYFTRAA